MSILGKTERLSLGNLRMEQGIMTDKTESNPKPVTDFGLYLFRLSAVSTCKQPLLLSALLRLVSRSASGRHKTCLTEEQALQLTKVQSTLIMYSCA